MVDVLGLTRNSSRRKGTGEKQITLRQYLGGNNNRVQTELTRNVARSAGEGTSRIRWGERRV